ncbi:MAG: tRNA 2-thiouridine(34) synthase MnmA [Candidatus Omnitrophica bacterium]|nr:tRNA 2-thiouridine(34) synthase MnmA [Candidatus Omnitrophota bacterium]
MDIVKGKKVVVGLSGGVDSSVAAFLLKDKGYDVYGVTLRLLSGENGKCRQEQQIEAAANIARVLGIKHSVVNAQRLFKKCVVDYFLREYKEGRTPNPCLRCNRDIKFSLLKKRAASLKAGFIATGHYAVIDYDKRERKYLLKRARDKSKEQTYFLYPLKQEDLKRLLFPLGHLRKKQVVDIAKKQKFFRFLKKESQEVCFVADNDYKSFFKKYSREPVKEGLIYDISGRPIGRHKGLVYYTVGQRKGLGLSDKYPLYVVDIDEKSNSIIAGYKKYLYDKEFEVDDVTSILSKSFRGRFEAAVKIRYGHKASPAVIRPVKNKRLKVVFKKKQMAITRGQTAVFYNRDVVLGGGTISNVTRGYNEKAG